MKTQQQKTPSILIEEKFSSEKSDWQNSKFTQYAEKNKDFFLIERSYHENNAIVKREIEIIPAFGISYDKALNLYYEMKSKQNKN